MSSPTKLEQLSSTTGVTLYELVAEESAAQGPKPRLFLASSRQTRAVLTRADLVSPWFEKYLRQGIGAIISRSYLAEVIDRSFGKADHADLLYILRGGLNFDAKAGLAQLGIAPLEHFVSSQRQRIPQEGLEDLWTITDKGYIKAFEREHEPREVNLVLGDIVASGSSLEHGLTTFFKQMRKNNHKLNSLLFFSIGGQQTEEAINRSVESYQHLLTDNFAANIVYLEGRFGLAAKNTPLPINNTGTDLLAYHEGAILTPEFALELLGKPERVLEECVIYDGGKRRSAQLAHFREVLEYWEKLKGLAENGLTLRQALDQRYPLSEIKTMEGLRAMHPYWEKVSDGELTDILAAVEMTYLNEDKDSSQRLTELCQERIGQISKKSHPKRVISLKDTTHHLGLSADFFEGVDTVLVAGEPARIDIIGTEMQNIERRIKTGRGLPALRGTIRVKSAQGYNIDVPIVAIATGMGLGSGDITGMEILQKFVLEPKRRDPAYIIRIGTCGTHQPQSAYGGDLIVADRVYSPFGAVDDFISTKHSDPIYNLEIGALQILERMIANYDKGQDPRDMEIDLETLAKLKDFLAGSETYEVVQRVAQRYISGQKSEQQTFPQEEQRNSDLELIRRRLALMEIHEVYPCDEKVVEYCLKAAEGVRLDGNKIHQGGIFSKQTLTSEAWEAFAMKPDADRKKALDYRKEALQQLGIFGSEMELAMMTAQAYRANQEGCDVRIGGIMAIVNNPRNPSRSHNPLFADEMTLSRAVQAAIEMGLRTAGIIYMERNKTEKINK